MSKDDEVPDVGDVLKALRDGLSEVTKDFQDAFEKFQEEAQYRFDKELGKQLAKHPELYADLKRGYRQLRKGMDKFAKDTGLR